jgi:D-lactate dehydrogenase (cytochrome)
LTLFLAFEFWDKSALHMFKKHATPKEVMEQEYPFYVLIETSGSNKDHDDEVNTKIAARQCSMG